MVCSKVMKFQCYSKLLLFSVIVLLSAVLLFPSYSYAFILGGFESLKGLHLGSANSFLSLGINHQSGLMLGFDLPPASPSSSVKYPGLRPVVQITPLLVLVAFVFFGIYRFYLGVKPVVAGDSVVLEDLVNAALGLILIGVGFLLFNVIIAATDAILRIIG